jgi:glutathione S-transferase
LYRDRTAACPFCQRVWLALEVKGIDYITVLHDEELRVEWPDGTTQQDSLDILERIQKEYPGEPNFYPKVSASVGGVRANIVRFNSVFPRNTDDLKDTPFLYRSGEVVQKSDHTVTLEETDEMLEEYDDGPFFCGATITAADIAWAPFLERYAIQLPLVYEDLKPRSQAYPELMQWYDKMERLVPCYSCRVQGDAKMWSKTLVGNEKLTATLPTTSVKENEFDAKDIWNAYRKDKPYVARTPSEECAARIVRNRETILSCLDTQDEDKDAALREVCAALVVDGKASLSGNARDVADFINNHWLSVPRDMGVLPATALQSLVALQPKPRIR